MEFVKGKWYHSPKWDGFYIKVDSFDGGKIYCKETIRNNAGHQFRDYSYDSSLETYKQISISEIRHLLPKDYKFEQEFNYYFY